MNDEIKKILEDIDNKECYYVGTNGCLYQDLTKEELLFIKDYITNLQQENENVQKLKERYQLEKEVYKTRINKAIEHIEKHQFIFQSQYKDESNFDNHLLDILQGDSNE